MGEAQRRGLLAVIIGVVLLIVGFGIALAGGAVIGTVEPPADVVPSERDVTMAWLARVLLVLAVAWVVIGQLSARTSLVRRPGAAAARATWIGSTRPWRARESTLGMLELDRWLLLIIPVGLLVGTRVVQTSFTSWSQVAIVIGAWAVFSAVVRLFVWERSPWPVIAAVGGVVMIHCILTLIPLSFTGPAGYWLMIWTEPVLRTLYIAAGFALFAWIFIAGGWALAAQLGARRATGAILAGVGAAMLIPALIIGLLGVDTILALANDETGLLPWGPAEMLGVTASVDIPTAAPWYAVGVGAVLTLVGVLMGVPGRRAAASGDAV